MTEKKNGSIRKPSGQQTPKQAATAGNAGKIEALQKKPQSPKPNTAKAPQKGNASKKTPKKPSKNTKKTPISKFCQFLEKNFTLSTLIAVVALILVAIFLLGTIVGVKIRSALEKKQDIEKFEDYIESASKEFGVPYDIVYAVIETESSFRPDVESSSGARGLMQINKITLEDININLGTNYSFNDLFDPEINIRLGTSYLSRLYKRFGNYETVYAAYNAGPTRVQEWLKDKNYSNDGKTLIHENIPIAETKRYVEKVKAFRENYLASQD